MNEITIDTSNDEIILCDGTVLGYAGSKAELLAELVDLEERYEDLLADYDELYAAHYAGRQDK